MADGAATRAAVTRAAGDARRTVRDAIAIAIAGGAAVDISREVAEREPLGFDRTVLLALHGVGPWLDAIARGLGGAGSTPAVRGD